MLTYVSVAVHHSSRRLQNVKRSRKGYKLDLDPDALLDSRITNATDSPECSEIVYAGHITCSTPSLAKVPCPVLKLLQPLLAHARSDIQKTALKIVKIDRPYLIPRHVQ